MPWQLSLFLATVRSLLCTVASDRIFISIKIKSKKLDKINQKMREKTCPNGEKERMFLSFLHLAPARHCRCVMPLASLAGWSSTHPAAFCIVTE